jgi:two-component system, NarL family, nitrate/nitrite response regulator NarL
MADVISLSDSSETIRVLTVDSTRMNSQMLADSLARDKRFRVCYAEPTSSAVMSAAESEKPHVVVLSAALEQADNRGFQVARDLHSAYRNVKVVMLLDASDRPAVVEAFHCGARGVFCRTESLKSLAKCIHSVHAGQVWANSAELVFLLESFREAAAISLPQTGTAATLSKREQDVIRCVAEGLTNREIAQRLTLTEHTVKNYLFRIFDKLGVSSRVEVVLFAFNMSRTSNLMEAVSDAPIPASKPTTMAVAAAAPGGSKVAPSLKAAPRQNALPAARDLRRVRGF